MDVEAFRQDMKLVYGEGKRFDLTVTSLDDDAYMELFRLLNAKDECLVPGIRLDAISVKTYENVRVFVSLILPNLIKLAFEFQGSMSYHGSNPYLELVNETLARFQDLRINDPDALAVALDKLVACKMANDNLIDIKQEIHHNLFGVN